ncbi:MAG: hypothetical protein MZU97_05440 [Bacillus subtilis]|nr:hypothetical protein [Bacillus subtilis]
MDIAIPSFMNQNVAGQVILQFVFSEQVSAQALRQIAKETKSFTRGDKFAIPQDTLIHRDAGSRTENVGRISNRS